MADIYNDPSLEKIRTNACKCGVCGEASYHPNHDSGDGGHVYVDGATEPIFVLRAQDITANETIGYWLSINAATLPPEKAEEARACQRQMLNWGKRKNPD